MVWKVSRVRAGQPAKKKGGIVDAIFLCISIIYICIYLYTQEDTLRAAITFMYDLVASRAKCVTGASPLPTPACLPRNADHGTTGRTQSRDETCIL